MLGRIGALMGVAGTLFSEAIVVQMRNFYEEGLTGELDRPLSNMALDDATRREAWVDWHNPHHHEAENRVISLLTAIANDAGLSYQQRRGKRQEQLS